MDKGIRPACNAKFLELLPARENTKAGNTLFRKTVIAYVMEEFGATLASAATHYNHAFINARELAKTNEVLAQQLVGLGRPEDKKGGRKPKVVQTPVAAAVEAVAGATQGEECVTACELLGYVNDTPAAADETAQAVEGAVVLSEGIKENTFEHTITTNPVIELFDVYKVAKGTVVAQGLTREQADELVAKAAAAKKAKLEARPQAVAAE